MPILINSKNPKTTNFNAPHTHRATKKRNHPDKDLEKQHVTANATMNIVVEAEIPLFEINKKSNCITVLR